MFPYGHKLQAILLIVFLAPVLVVTSRPVRRLGAEARQGIRALWRRD